MGQNKREKGGIWEALRRKVVWKLLVKGKRKDNVKERKGEFRFKVKTDEGKKRKKGKRGN